MFDALRLIPPLQVLFANEIEFNEDSFSDLTTTQHDAMRFSDAKEKL